MGGRRGRDGGTADARNAAGAHLVTCAEDGGSKGRRPSRIEPLEEEPASDDGMGASTRHLNVDRVRPRRMRKRTTLRRHEPNGAQPSNEVRASKRNVTQTRQQPSDALHRRLRRASCSTRNAILHTTEPKQQQKKKKYLRGIPPTCGDDSKEVTRSRLCLVPTGKTTPFATCTEWHSQSRSDGTGFGEHRNELAFLVQADRVVAASHVFAADEHVWNRPLSRPVMQSRLKRTSVRFRFEVADGNVRKGFEGRVQAQDPSFRSSSCALARSSRDLGGVFRARSELHVHI